MIRGSTGSIYTIGWLTVRSEMNSLIINQIRPAPQKKIFKKVFNQISESTIKSQIRQEKLQQSKKDFTIKILFYNQNPFWIRILFLNQTRIPILARTYTSSGPFWDPFWSKSLRNVRFYKGLAPERGCNRAPAGRPPVGQPGPA